VSAAVFATAGRRGVPGLVATASMAAVDCTMSDRHSTQPSGRGSVDCGSVSRAKVVETASS